MASGMEMMAISMLKNMGIDKDALMAQANEAIVFARGADARFAAMEARLGSIENKLDDLLSLMLTSHDRTGIVPAGGGDLIDHLQTLALRGEITNLQITDGGR